jgi:hypothetical protein
MISCFKGKIDAPKAVRMNFNRESDYVIMHLVLLVGFILCTAGKHRMHSTNYVFAVMVAACVTLILNQCQHLQNRSGSTDLLITREGFKSGNQRYLKRNLPILAIRKQIKYNLAVK